MGYKGFSPHPFESGKTQLAQSGTANSTSSTTSSGSNSDTIPSPERQHTLLLTRNPVPALLSKFGLTEARGDSGKLEF